MRFIRVLWPVLVMANLSFSLSCDKLKNDDDEDDDKITDEVINSPVNKLFYGNWCGPLKSGPDAAADSLDSCCQVHDGCYDEIGDDLNYFQCHKAGAKADCDTAFVACVKALSDTASEWTNPPAKPEEALTYKKEATLVFAECSAD